MPDARDQFAADDRRPHAIPHRMARVLRLLPDPARAHEPGSLDSPEIAFVSLAAMAERAQPIYGASPPRHREVRRIGRSRFTDGTLAHVRTPGGSTRPTKSCVRLSWSPPNLHACAGLTRSNRRVRTRTHGGVGGAEPKGSPLSRSLALFRRNRPSCPCPFTTVSGLRSRGRLVLVR